MLYQNVHRAVENLDRIHVPLREAILADSIEEMTERGEQAQVAADQILGAIEEGLEAHGAGRVERVFVQAAVNALQLALTQAQRISLATDVSGVRAALLDFKTQVDFADAYLRLALGELEP
jgi:hypothetical protein